MQRGKLTCRANSKRVPRLGRMEGEHNDLVDNWRRDSAEWKPEGGNECKQTRYSILRPYLKHHYNERTPRQQSPHLTRILTRHDHHRLPRPPLKTIFQHVWKTYPVIVESSPSFPTRKLATCGLSYDDDEEEEESYPACYCHVCGVTLNVKSLIKVTTDNNN